MSPRRATYFLLLRQKKGTAPPGAHPGSCIQTPNNVQKKTALKGMVLMTHDIDAALPIRRSRSRPNPGHPRNGLGPAAGCAPSPRAGEGG